MLALLCPQVYVSRGQVFPEDPYEQLKAAIRAVFDSWQSDRAKVYLAVNQIKGLKVGGWVVVTATIA
jgi:phosphoenolpyruvate synthase/pyruvate phosphate dikinase